MSSPCFLCSKSDPNQSHLTLAWVDLFLLEVRLPHECPPLGWRALNSVDHFYHGQVAMVTIETTNRQRSSYLASCTRVQQQCIYDRLQMGMPGVNLAGGAVVIVRPVLWIRGAEKGQRRFIACAVLAFDQALELRRWRGAK